MPIATTPVATASLITQAQCLAKCVNKGMELPILIVIFAKLANMPLNTNALIAQANCIAKCLPQGLMLPALIGIAANLTSAGGSTGSGQVLMYTGTDPTTAGIFPASTNLPAIAYDQAGISPLFSWNVSTQAWI